ncbi:MAG: J domain-containing protein [Planctomycetota bacterium]
MSDTNANHSEAEGALDATIQRSAGVVRRGRRRRGFLKTLGLSLPVTVDDVKQAFYARARVAHPDHQGNAEQFVEIQQAFDEAVEYAKRNGKRLPWLGAQLPIYVAQRRVIELIEELGGTIEVQQLDWLEDTVGEDFAQLADRVTAIDLAGLPVTDEHLNQLTEDAEGLQFVEAMSLADTAITDASALRLTRVVNLRRLDLRGTDVSYALRRQLAKLPGVERVEGASRWSELFRR